MWWKIYFWIISILLSIASIDMLSNPVKHLYMALVDTATSILLIIGLYSYVFKKVIFPSIIWKYVFWITIISIVLAEYYRLFPNSLVAPYLSYLISIEPEPMNPIENIIAYALVLPLLSPLFYAVFQIAKNTWSKDAKNLKLQTKKIKTHLNTYKNVLTNIKNISKIKKASKLKIVLSAIGLFIFSLILFFVLSIWQAMNQLPYVEKMVDTYLFDMANEHYSSAYGLYSEEYKKYEDFATFERKRKAFRYGFKDYKNLESNSINVNYYFGEFPMINYSGRMNYIDGEQARVTATFIYVNNNWEMVEVFVVAPPDRWQK